MVENRFPSLMWRSREQELSSTPQLIIFDCNQWGHAQDLEGRFEGSSHLFSGIIGQSVRKAEYWGVILALHKHILGSIWVLTMSTFSRKSLTKIDKGITGTPLPLIKGGDLLAVITFHVATWRGNETVKVSKVKGHASQAMVDNGDVRHEDLLHWQ